MAVTSAQRKIMRVSMARGVTMLVVAALSAGCGARGSADRSTTTAVTAAALKPSTTTTRAEIGTTIPGAVGGALGAEPVITSVVFSGDESSPVITISGRSLGTRPPPYPPEPPSKYNFQDGRNCNPTDGEEGLDFGNQLLVRTEENNFSAGRYQSPENAELDCVGLLVEEFTESRVVLRLGGAYRAGLSMSNFTIRNGYHFEVVVNSAVFRGHVQYVSQG